MEKCFDAHPFPGSVGLKYLGKVRKDFLPTKKPRFDLSSRLEGCYISNLAVKFPEFHGFLRFSQSPETGNRETGKLTHGKNSSYLKSPN